MNRLVASLQILGLLLVVVRSGSAAEPSPGQAAVLRKIERIKGKGKVTIDEKSPGKPVIGVDLSHVTMGGFFNLEELKARLSRNGICQRSFSGAVGEQRRHIVRPPPWRGGYTGWVINAAVS